MALIKCPECEKEVSSAAPSCPHCGFVLNAAAPVQQDNSAELEKYLELATQAIQGQNSDQVEKYCDSAKQIDPRCSRAWELEARGILFSSSLKDNKIPQAISAASNAVKYAQEENKDELAISLYDSIAIHIEGLLSIATGMPIGYAPQYVVQCMNYYGMLLSGIEGLPKSKIEAELASLAERDVASKKAFFPKKRLFYASHALKPTWAEQFRTLLEQKGIL